MRLGRASLWQFYFASFASTHLHCSSEATGLPDCGGEPRSSEAARDARHS